MPRYFFNIINRDRLIPDDEGLELPGDEEALLEARASALDLLKDAGVSVKNVENQVIEVIESDRIVERVRLTFVSDRSGVRRNR